PATSKATRAATSKTTGTATSEATEPVATGRATEVASGSAKAARASKASAAGAKKEARSAGKSVTSSASEAARAVKRAVRSVTDSKPRTGPVDQVTVSEGALATIIGLAAHEVPGVVGMAPSNIGEGIRRILGVRQVDEGVELTSLAKPLESDVDIHVIVAYGVNIPVVASGVRDRVRYAARHYAGVTLKEVTVHV